MPLVHLLNYSISRYDQDNEAIDKKQHLVQVKGFSLKHLILAEEPHGTISDTPRLPD
jgi:hypothetical protein